MRIVTNQGSNLHLGLVAHYDLDLVAQEICVDGVRYDTRDGIALDQVDQWVQTAREHPYVLGTSASQLAGSLVEIAKEDPEILFVTSSRKIIRTFDAAMAALRALEKDRHYAALDIRVVDTGTTDVGAALPVLLAAEARRAGETLDQIEARVAAFCRAGRMAIYVSKLEGLIKGGRASFLQGWVANLLRVRPVLRFEDGELRAAARVSTKDDEARVLAEQLAEGLGTDRVWAGVTHGNDPDRCRRLVDALRGVFQLEYLYDMPLAPSIYLHASSGSVGAAVFPAPSDLPAPEGIAAIGRPAAQDPGPA